MNAGRYESVFHAGSHLATPFYALLCHIIFPALLLLILTYILYNIAHHSPIKLFYNRGMHSMPPHALLESLSGLFSL
jgi:hypothetical protein